MKRYNELVESFDDELAAKGYTPEQIEQGKSWARQIRNRRVDALIENNGTVSPLFADGDCAKALLALMCAEALG